MNFDFFGFFHTFLETEEFFYFKVIWIAYSFVDEICGHFSHKNFVKYSKTEKEGKLKSQIQQDSFRKSNSFCFSKLAPFRIRYYHPPASMIPYLQPRGQAMVGFKLRFRSDLLIVTKLLRLDVGLFSRLFY